MPSRSSQYTRSVVQRTIYKDFTPNLNLLPVTGELLILKNEQAVAQSIKNLVLTFPTERYYNNAIGSTVAQSLFEFVDDFTIDTIRSTIQQTIANFEPRAINVSVNVDPHPADHYVNVTIQFGISLNPSQQFSVPTIVLKTRG